LNLIFKGEKKLLLPGFSDPVLESQRSFRILLEAMSHPGRVFPLEVGMKVPEPLHIAAAALALALLDFDTPLWTDLAPDSEAANWIRFHSGCPLAEDPFSGRFGLITGDCGLSLMSRFHPGLDEFPEESATVIIQVDGLVFGNGKKLTGPGIEKEHYLAVEGLPEDFWGAWKANHHLYPLGVDVILTTWLELAALPRTTRVE
jgi:alpha-D-ribose 1-methylphosphonate 5-triphosphate synthase subunit PhnH